MMTRKHGNNTPMVPEMRGPSTDMHWKNRCITTLYPVSRWAEISKMGRVHSHGNLSSDIIIELQVLVQEI